MPRGERRLGAYTIASALALLALVSWSVWVVVSASALRADVEANVGTLTELGRLRAQVEPGAAAAAATPDERAAAARRILGRVARRVPAAAPDARALADALAAGELGRAPAIIDRLSAAVRARNREVSLALGARWRYLYGVAAVVIALAGALLVVAEVSARRRRRAEDGEATLAARDRMLHDAARRWAAGELDVPVQARGDDLDEFEQALEHVRLALAERVDAVEAQRREIAQLADDLRAQVRQKSEQLAEALARVPARASLGVGAVIAGRFEIERVLGHGGMGMVYAVRRLADGRRLALKLMRDPGDDTQRARFVREARLLAEIDHANVVRVYDVDVTDDGALFLVTELIEGQHLGGDARRPLHQALQIVRAVAAGLAAIHARGIVHRDLKLANIMVGATPEDPVHVVKIVDFGIARGDGVMVSSSGLDRAPATDGDADTGTTATAVAALVTPSPSPGRDLTRDDVVLGTLRYLPPECRTAAMPGPAWDVFAFGVVAFWLLFGTFPWSKSAAVLVKERGALPAPVVPRRVPPPPERVLAIVLRCLAEDPAQRPTATDVVAAFEA